jgi:ABC-type bacteriocin/lantibiotic exporter with double-glycine peptidase domain
MKKKYSNNLNIFYLIKKTWGFLSRKRKKEINFLFLIVLVNSFTELISLISIVPFLAVIVNPSSIYDIYFIKEFAQLIKITNANEMLLPLTGIFLFGTLISGMMRLIFYFLTYRVAGNIGSELSSNAFKNSLYQSYNYHLNTNSNILITTLSKDINEIIYMIFVPIIQLISALIISIVIIFSLLFINFYISFSSLIIISILYYLFFRSSSYKIAKFSKRNLLIGQSLTKLVQESLGAIREIIISNNYNFYIQKHLKDEKFFRREVGTGTFLLTLPRLIIEPAGIILLAFFGYILIISGESKQVIPIIGTFSFSALKLLPYVQKMYEGINYPRLAKSRLINLLNILEKDSSQDSKQTPAMKIKLKQSINFINLGFSYSKESSPIFKDLNLTINSGDKIGIIGETGSGKSTFLDILTGLLPPTDGRILIDEVDLYDNNMKRLNILKGWQRYLTNVPQNIFITDSTIAENIALGINKKNINYEKIDEVIEIALLTDFINKSHNGINTIVGEQGLMLSGGQKQRIGIARALYKGSKFLILDEATSAIDSQTEELIMNNLNKIGSNMTIISVAHRLNSLKFCNKIYELKEGKLIETNLFNK